MDRPIRRNITTSNLPPPMRQSRYRRKGVKQSRTGCDECRRRKVKCDERIWLCKNCERGGRSCTWSRREQESATMLQVPKNTHAQTPLTPITNTGSPSATTATSYELTNYNNQIYRLPATPERANSSTESSQQVENARQLVFRSYIDDFPILHDVLNGTLFQYEHLLQSTQAAASALIAATEQLQNSDPTRSPAIANNTWTAYDTAVSVFSTELQTATMLPTSGPLTCVFLMCLELISRRRQDASAHLMGLSRIAWAQRTHANFEERQQFDYLETALRCFEIHRMASSDRVPVAEIDPIPLMNINLATQDLRSLSQRVIEVVHASYCFISRSAHRITDEFTQFALETERRSFSEAITKTSDMISGRLQTETEQQPYAHLLRLRCICLAMYIELETLFTKSETSYDNFAEQFKTIVVSAEAILGLRQQSNTFDESLAFSLQLGIAQPLYLTAMKYRHSAWRKRACNCLNQVGQEGPWRGPLLAATAQRCAMVEEAQDALQTESASVPAHQATNTMAGLKNWQAYFGSRMPREPQSVPEEYRIMTCRFADDTSVPDTSAKEIFSFPNTAANMTETNIIFAQRSGEITPCSIRTLSTQELADSNASNLIVWSDFIRF